MAQTGNQGTTFAGLVPEDYTVTVRSTVDNTCETSGSTVTVNAVPGAPQLL